MDLSKATAQTFVPDGIPLQEALGRTTHLAIGAHQDDLEIMAIDGILAGYQRQDQWFTGVTVTNGAGSPREGLYKDFTDEEMRSVRATEQRKAAYLGDYAAQFLLDYSSKEIKDSANKGPVKDLAAILKAARPNIVYTHNLADKHPTHVAVALRTVAAMRSLPADQKPDKLIGCEVWRDLGWMLDEDKIVLDCSEHENLQAALIGVFDSQIAGGKRYDLATLARRRANATYFASHEVDRSTGVSFGMDLTPLIQNPDLDILAFVQSYIQRFADDVTNLITVMQGGD